MSERPWYWLHAVTWVVFIAVGISLYRIQQAGALNWESRGFQLLYGWPFVAWDWPDDLPGNVQID